LGFFPLKSSEIIRLFIKINADKERNIEKPGLGF